VSSTCTPHATPPHPTPPMPPRTPELDKPLPKPHPTFHPSTPPQITKLGEGTYGEVFRAPPSNAYLDSLDPSEAADPPASIVVKIIPMEGDLEVNGAPQKGAGDLMAEAVIALALSGLRTPEDVDGGSQGLRLGVDRSGMVVRRQAGWLWCCFGTGLDNTRGFAANRTPTANRTQQACGCTVSRPHLCAPAAWACAVAGTPR